MENKPIKSERDYRRVLKEIDGLMDAQANTAAGERLDVLATLAVAWEAKHYPIHTTENEICDVNLEDYH